MSLCVCPFVPFFKNMLSALLPDMPLALPMFKTVQECSSRFQQVFSRFTEVYRRLKIKDARMSKKVQKGSKGFKKIQE